MTTASPNPQPTAVTLPSIEIGEREMSITRLIDAPPELVFKVWTEREHISQWYGPNGFTTTTYQMNVTPGGVWRFVMHGPDGVDYPNRIIYIEVVRPERLVFWHDAGEDDDPARFQTTVTFVEHGGKTKLTMRWLFTSEEEFDKVKAFGAIEGGVQTLDGLAAYVATMRYQPERK